MSRSTAVIDDSFWGVSEERAHVLGDFPVGIAMGPVFTLIEPPLTQRFIVGFRASIQLLIKVDFSVVHQRVETPCLRNSSKSYSVTRRTREG